MLLQAIFLLSSVRSSNDSILGDAAQNIEIQHIRLRHASGKPALLLIQRGHELHFFLHYPFKTVLVCHCRTWRELAAAEAGRRGQVVEAWRDPLRMRSDEELPWRLSKLQYLS